MPTRRDFLMQTSTLAAAFAASRLGWAQQAAPPADVARAKKPLRILFIGGTPIMWQGPVANWIRACEWIEALDVDHVVPGHGPVTDRSGARAVREYLCYVRDEARKRYDAGMPVEKAMRDIALGEYRHWLDRERIAVNVDALYREFAGGGAPAKPLELWGVMAELAAG